MVDIMIAARSTWAPRHIFVHAIQMDLALAIDRLKGLSRQQPSAAVGGPPARWRDCLGRDM